MKSLAHFRKRLARLETRMEKLRLAVKRANHTARKALRKAKQ